MGFRVLLTVVAWLGGAATAAAEDTKEVAFFGFELINSSLEPTSEEESARVAMLNQLYRDKLAESAVYEVIGLSDDIKQRVAAAPEIRNCNGCELDFARDAGADIAAWGTVQKVSNLILNINLYMTDVATGEAHFVRSVDIRGNTDETWRHGLNYMLKNYLLKQQ